MTLFCSRLLAITMFKMIFQRSDGFCLDSTKRLTTRIVDAVP